MQINYKITRLFVLLAFFVGITSWQIVQAQTKETMWTARYDGAVSGIDEANTLAMSPDGKTLFVGGWSTGSNTGPDMFIIAYDANSGQEKWKARYDNQIGESEYGHALVVSPDGNTVYLGGRSHPQGFVIVAYHVSDGSEKWVKRYDSPGMSGIGEVLRMHISADGQTLFAGGGTLRHPFNYDLTTFVMNANDGQLKWVDHYNTWDGDYNLNDYYSDLAISPDGSIVISSGSSAQPVDGAELDFTVVAYEVSTGNQLWTQHYDGPISGRDAMAGLSISPDSKTLFVSGGSQGPNRMDYVAIAYDLQTGAEKWLSIYNDPADWTDRAMAQALSPDGKQLYITGDSWTNHTTGFDAVTVAFDTENGDQLWVGAHNSQNNGYDWGMDLEVSPNNQIVLAGANTDYTTSNVNLSVAAFNAMSGAQLWTVEYDGPAQGTDRFNFGHVNSLAFSPNSEMAFVTGKSQGVGTDFDIITYAVRAVSSCDISSVYAGDPYDCDPITDTYSRDIYVVYGGDDLPAHVQVMVDGGEFVSYPLTGSPQMITLEDLPSNGEEVEVFVKIEDGCTFQGDPLFTNPQNCTGPHEDCEMESLIAGAQTCAGEDTYNQEIILTYADAPETGSIVVKINNENSWLSFPITGSPQTLLLENLPANGDEVDIFVKFTDDNQCTIDRDRLFTAPNECNEVPPTADLSFTLIDASNNTPITAYDPILEGASIDLGTLGTSNLSIRANAEVEGMIGFQFHLNGPENWSQYEGVMPYALFGDSEGDYYTWVNGGPSEGNYTLTGTPKLEGWVDGESTVLNFSFTDGAARLSREFPLGMTVYPNPTKGELNVYLQTEKPEVFQIQVFSLIGNEVYQTTLNAPGERRLVLSDLPNGIYLVKAKSEDESFVKKVWKK